VQGSYLALNGRYQLNVLGSAPGMLPAELERALLRWLWKRPDGIGADQSIRYLEVPLSEPPPHQKPGPFDRWLASLELLARCFPAWVDLARDAIEWLWAQQNEQGLWDFVRSPSSSCLPLSPTGSWRQREDRVFDWTARALILLSRATSGRCE
jgi:hypothetical protein